MNQIENILQFLPGYDLRLWTDAKHPIDTLHFKHLVQLVIEQLDLELLRIDAYYYQEWRCWTITFRWHTPDGLRAGIDYLIQVEHFERCIRCGLLNVLGSEISDRIKRTSTSNPALLCTEAEVCVTNTPIPLVQTPTTIGDRTCKYNAKSQHLRCAANPCGPCQGCQHYEKI